MQQEDFTLLRNRAAFVVLRCPDGKQRHINLCHVVEALESANHGYLLHLTDGRQVAVEQFDDNYDAIKHFVELETA